VSPHWSCWYIYPWDICRPRGYSNLRWSDINNWVILRRHPFWTIHTIHTSHVASFAIVDFLILFKIKVNKTKLKLKKIWNFVPLLSVPSLCSISSHSLRFLMDVGLSRRRVPSLVVYNSISSPPPNHNWFTLFIMGWRWSLSQICSLISWLKVYI